MKILRASLRPAFFLSLSLAPAAAQFFPHRAPQPRLDLPFSVGGYLSLGLQSPNPGNSGITELATLGIYGELNRGFLHPGLDLRGSSTNDNVGGTLVGPRLAFSYNVLHPYLEGLIGPNHLVRDTQNFEGVDTSFIAGLDLDYGTNVRWRVLEYSQGFFTGLPGSRPRTLSTGLVVVFP